MANLKSRLNKISDKIKEDKFIYGRGLGNEISFYIFDYDPEDELEVRDYIKILKKEFSNELFDRKIIEFDLYKMLLDITKERRIFDRAFDMEERQGKDALFKAMTTFANPEIFLDEIQEQMSNHNVVFLTGIGKVYPFVRSHNILNNLQEILDKMPVIMFYPGKYNGQSLQLFGKYKENNYYRAFRLVD